MRIPKYYQVKEQITALVEASAPGRSLPTERELAVRYGTSRTTVRQALTELVIEGRLERTQGRGTFVAEPKVVQLRQLNSFSTDVSSGGRSPSGIVLGLRKVAADPEVADALALAESAPVLRLERLRGTAGHPVAHEVAFLVPPLLGLRRLLDRHGSLYRTLALEYGIRMARADDLIETALAGPQEADLLGVDVGLPMLLVRRTAWDETGRPVEFTRSCFRGDRFRFLARSRIDERADDQRHDQLREQPAAESDDQVVERPGASG